MLNNLLDQPVMQAQEHEPPIFYTDFPEIIDNTAREQWSICPRKFYHSSINKLSMRASSVHLHFGAAFALGLEVMRRCYYGENLPESKALTEAIKAATEYYGNFVPPEKSNKTYEHLIHGLAAYLQHYPMHSDYIKPYQFDDNRLGIEFTFAIPLPEVLHPVTGNPIIYAGRFDMLAVYNNSLFVMDDKTASQLGPSWLRQWDTSQQLTGYCWAAKQANLPIIGAIVRGQSFLKSSFGFAEAIQYRPEWRIDEWYENLICEIKEMITAWKTNNFRKKLNSSCSQYSGCPYNSACTNTESVAKVILEMEFKNHLWNPLEKNPEKESEAK